MNKVALEASLAALDTWIQIFAVLVAIGILGEVGFGVRHWILNRELQRLQSSEDQERQAEIARLNKEAGDARKSAGEANERASKAEERAAKANRKAEEERLARLKIEEGLAPRRITAEQAAKLSSNLRPLIGKKVSLFVITGDPETGVFGDLLAGVLTGAGLTVEITPGMIFGNVKPGISLIVGNNRIADANILAKALLETGLAEKPVDAKHSGQADDLQMIIAPKY